MLMMNDLVPPPPPLRAGWYPKTCRVQMHRGCHAYLCHLGLSVRISDGWLCMQYPLCLKLMESKKVDVTPLITHRFGFTAGDVAAAFDTASRASETGAIKVMFNL